MYRVYLSFGGNVGDVEATIIRSVRDLISTGLCQLERLSSLYQTPPWGNISQDYFFNACAKFATELEPEIFLRLCQAIELKHGRERVAKWGPRTIDIDLLLYDAFENYNSDSLIMPHPFMLQRGFVLKPLHEIAPELIIARHSIAEYLKTIPELDTIKRCKNSLAWQNLAYL